MAHNACLICLASSVSGHHRNALGKGGIVASTLTKLKQSSSLDIYVLESRLLCLVSNEQFVLLDVCGYGTQNIQSITI
jgi:hypothetical protein